MRLNSRIDYQRIETTPMLMIRKCIGTKNILGRITSRKRRPQKVVQISAGKLAIVNNHDPSGAMFARYLLQLLAKCIDLLVAESSICVRRPLYNSCAWLGQVG